MRYVCVCIYGRPLSLTCIYERRFLSLTHMHGQLSSLSCRSHAHLVASVSVALYLALVTGVTAVFDKVIMNHCVEAFSFSGQCSLSPLAIPTHLAGLMAAASSSVAETAPMAATAPVASAAIVAAPRTLGPHEHLVIVNEAWLCHPMTTRTTRAPSSAAAHRIAKSLEDDRTPIETKTQLIIETAVRDPELWSAVRRIMHINFQLEQTKLLRERQRAEREAEVAEATRGRQEENQRIVRARVLRSVNTDEVQAEHVSRGNRG